MFKIFYLFDFLISLSAVFSGSGAFFITLSFVLLISFVMRSNESAIFSNHTSRRVSLVGSLLFYLLLFLIYIIVFKKISYFIFIPLIDIILKNTILYRLKYITKKVYFLSDEEIKELSFGEKNYDSVKRVLDIILSIFMLVLLSPIFLIIYFLIAILDGKPAIIKQKRIGRDEKEFYMYKFRTYKFDGETKTKIGKIIRPIRFDELPQFFNVLKGDMSVVGPR